jgi:hypothetical protein
MLHYTENVNKITLLNDSIIILLANYFLIN